MGMYDNVDAPAQACPSCKAKGAVGVLHDWQTKDGDCMLSTLKVREVHNFYTFCTRCSQWAEYIREEEGHVLYLEGERTDSVIPPMKPSPFLCQIEILAKTASTPLSPADAETWLVSRGHSAKLARETCQRLASQGYLVLNDLFRWTAVIPSTADEQMDELAKLLKQACE